MNLVIITAIGVGGATVVGALIGFLFKVISHKFSDVVLGFAAGIMLAASMIGLIIPSIESGGKHGIWISVLGILIGALFLDFADKLTPHLHRLTGMDREKHSSNAKINKVMLFVLAIAIHNLPEGMAAGVGFGSDNISSAMIVAIGIALQNIPEGMVIISGTVLPFLLAFAGGTMLYIISDEMIPETHSHGFEKYATYSLLVGFIVMLIMDFYIS